MLTRLTLSGNWPIMPNISFLVARAGSASRCSPPRWHPTLKVTGTCSKGLRSWSWSSESHPSLLDDGRVATELGKAKCAGGRVDMVVWMPCKTYVFEMKVSGTAREALEQIDSKSYALPFNAEGHEVVKIGVKFNKDTRTPEEWVVEEKEERQ